MTRDCWAVAEGRQPNDFSVRFRGVGTSRYCHWEYVDLNGHFHEGDVWTYEEAVLAAATYGYGGNPDGRDQT